MTSRRRARDFIALAATGVLALALTSCSSPADHGGADPRIQGQWQLTEATDAGGRIDLLSQAITLTIRGDTTTTGRSSCSDYKARFLGMAESLWVTATLPRTIDCGSAPQQGLETRYITALNYVRAASVTGGVLDLTAPGIDLHYVRALYHPMTRLIGHDWALSSVGFLGLEGTAGETEYGLGGLELRLDKDGTLEADSACTTVKAHYYQDAGQIVADRVSVHTIDTCTDVNSAADNYIVRLIDSSFSFSTLQSGQLTLTSPRAGAELVFTDDGEGAALAEGYCQRCDTDSGGGLGAAGG